jgi:hypothetical protein
MIENRETAPRFRLKGTIVDIETTGGINFQNSPRDPSYYEDLRPTILGYLTDDLLVQHCAESEEEIEDLIGVMSRTQFNEPIFALNTRFERSIFSKFCQRDLWITDVRLGISGSKWDIRERLGIPTYDDPFEGDSARCDPDWVNGDYENCLRHNRACLLIERDILYSRLLPEE